MKSFSNQRKLNKKSYGAYKRIYLADSFLLHQNTPSYFNRKIRQFEKKISFKFSSLRTGFFIYLNSLKAHKSLNRQNFVLQLAAMPLIFILSVSLIRPAVMADDAASTTSGSSTTVSTLPSSTVDPLTTNEQVPVTTGTTADTSSAATVSDSGSDTPPSSTVDSVTTDKEVPITTKDQATVSDSNINDIAADTPQNTTSSIDTIVQPSTDATPPTDTTLADDSNLPDTQPSSTVLDNTPDVSATDTPATDLATGANQVAAPEELFTTAKPSQDTPAIDTLTVSDDISTPDLATTTEDSNYLEIVNDNNSTTTNDILASGNTGENVINSDTGTINNATTTTGDVNVFANVLNVVNTNSVNSNITEIIQNFNDLAANIILNNPTTTAPLVADALISAVCGQDVECKSLNSYVLTNQNTASLQNTVNASGLSGNNSITGEVQNSPQINTGNVNALVNILNIVNSNLDNSVWTIASINVFGNWQGDLVLPSQLYFANAMSIGGIAQSPESGQEINLSVGNANQSNIGNNISVTAQSGGNIISAGAGNDGEAAQDQEGTGGKINNASIQTGDANAVANVQNYANTNITNSSWYLGIINTLGQWSGNIFYMPSQITGYSTPSGLIFTSFTPNGNSNSADSSVDTSISNKNDATVNNQVTVSAITGGNAISGDRLNDPSIKTGNAYALANVMNFSNTNLVNSNLQLGLVNIFGNWDGNVIFGYPDLAVDQSSSQNAFPAQANQEVDYTIHYSNLGESAAGSGSLSWSFDPSVLAIDSVDSSAAAQQGEGSINFSLGQIALGSSGAITVHAHTLRNLGAGTLVKTDAKIQTDGPEQNLDNNEFVLSSTVDNSGGSGGGSGGGIWGDSGKVSVHVYKTNSANGQPVPAGGTVEFTLTIENDSDYAVHDLTINDILTGPDGNTINTQAFNVGFVDVSEQVTLTYDMNLPEGTAPGNYTNSASAMFLSSANMIHYSDETAKSSFTVSGSGYGGRLGPGLLGFPDTLSSINEQVSTTSEFNQIIFNRHIKRGATRTLIPEVLGTSTDTPGNYPGGNAQNSTVNIAKIKLFDPPLLLEVLLGFIIALFYATIRSWMRAQKKNLIKPAFAVSSVPDILEPKQKRYRRKDNNANLQSSI